MKDNKVIRAFFGGILLMFLVIFAAGLLMPSMLGRAQEGEGPGNLSENASGASGEANQTDDPLGREAVPVSDEGNPVPNNLLESAPDTLSSGRTDDPQGRTFIPFSDEPNTPEDNLASAQTTGGVFDAVASQENVLREQQLIEQYTSPLVIPAADFAADGANPDSMFFPFGGGYFQGNGDIYGCMVAPAYLPEGATVTDMFVSVYDNDATYNLTVNLRRADNFAGGTTTMANASSSGQFAGIQTISTSSITDPLVDYPDYAYYVTTCVLSGNIRIYSVRLYYTLP
jgi:hypothetical protein